MKTVWFDLGSTGLLGTVVLSYTGDDDVFKRYHNVMKRFLGVKFKSSVPVKDVSLHATVDFLPFPFVELLTQRNKVVELAGGRKMLREDLENLLSFIELPLSSVVRIGHATNPYIYTVPFQFTVGKGLSATWFSIFDHIIKVSDEYASLLDTLLKIFDRFLSSVKFNGSIYPDNSKQGYDLAVLLQLASMFFYILYADYLSKRNLKEGKYDIVESIRFLNKYMPIFRVLEHIVVSSETKKEYKVSYNFLNYSIYSAYSLERYLTSLNPSVFKLWMLSAIDATPDGKELLGDYVVRGATYETSRLLFTYSDIVYMNYVSISEPRKTKLVEGDSSSYIPVNIQNMTYRVRRNYFADREEIDISIHDRNDLLDKTYQVHRLVYRNALETYPLDMSKHIVRKLVENIDDAHTFRLKRLGKYFSSNYVLLKDLTVSVSVVQNPKSNIYIS